LLDGLGGVVFVEMRQCLISTKTTPNIKGTITMNKIKTKIMQFRDFIIRNRRMILLILIYFTFFITASTFMLIILTSPKGEVKVPLLTGKKFTFVYNSLERNSLKAELKYEDVYDIEDGVILSQYPEAGAVVSKGDKVKLLISRNDLSIEVPTLVGFGLPNAKNKLSKLHAGERSVSLAVGIVCFVPSKSQENVIIMQNPSAGEKVSPDTKVNLLVSSGETGADLNMPAITGQAIDLATLLVMAKGCVLEQEIVKTDKREESGIIIAQSVKDGTVLAKGQSISVKVGYYPVTEHFYNSYEKLDFEIPASYGDGYYEALVSDDSGERVCYAGKKTAGKMINFVFARQGNAKVKIIKDKKQETVIGVKMTDF
jgi:eukaryotic-like serine/threonine-protein kinase